MAETDETKALAREVGQRSVAQLEAGLTRMASEVGATGRWILASLVTLNGGGVIAMATGHDVLSRETMSSATSLFVIGASLAVISALASLIGAQFLAPLLGRASVNWSRVAQTGDNIEEANEATKRFVRAGRINSIAPIALGFLSLVLFIGGALTLASGLAGETGPEAAPVQAAQMSVGTPPLPARTPEPAAVPTQEPAAATRTPAPTPAPAAKAPPPEPKRTPGRAPRASETNPAPSSAPAATPPPAAAPAPVQQPAPTPPAN